MPVIAAIALGLVAAVVTGPLSASAETPTPAPSSSSGGDPGTFILYTGTATRTDTDSDGKKHEADPVDFAIGVRCDGDVCEVYGLPWVPADLSTPIDGATAEYSVAASGDVCGSGQREQQVSFTFTPTVLTGTIDQPPVGWVDCDGTQTYFWGIHLDFVGAFDSGDPCVLEGEACPPTPSPTPTPASAPPASGVALPFWTPRPPGTESVLSGLSTPDETLSPTQFAWAAGFAVVLMILVAFPTQLFNSASERAAERLSTWRARRRARRAEAAGDGASAAATATAPDAAVLKGWPAAGAGVLLASFIAAWVDPKFGFDLPSLRVLLSIVVAFAVEIVLGWFVLVRVVRRLHPGAVASYEFRALTLFIVVAAVAFTRLTGFQPGIVFGLVAGVAFGALLAAADRARVALLGLAWSFLIAIVAWLGYWVLTGAGDNPFAVFGRETLSAMAAAGIAALPIALFPLRGLVGGTVFAWNRVVWAACYAVGLLGFFLVLMPMPTSWGEVPLSLWAWLAIYLAYAIAAVGLWLAVAQPWKKTDADAQPAS